MGTCISCARSGIATRPTTIPRGATRFRRMPTSRIRTGRSFWGRRRSARGIRTGITNGACIGITRAAFRPICWCTRPISSTSCWTGRCRFRAWRRAGFTAGRERTTIATHLILSARFTNIRASCRSTTPVISATTIMAMASSYAAMRAPSKC